VEFPVYLWIGPLPIHPHPVFESLAYLVGARLYGLLKARRGDVLDSEQRWWVVVAAFVGAAFGAKLAPWLAHPELTLAHRNDPLVLLAGKSSVGALVGGLLAVEAAKRWIGISQATGDLFALPLTVGIMVGRIGCFLSGLDDHTYGLPASLPWAVDFGDGIPRHPAQLYEIAFLGLMVLPGLLWLERRPYRQGDLFKLFMVGYLGFRLWLEFVKPGEPLGPFNGLQWICLAGLAWYGCWLINLVRPGLARPSLGWLRGG
jgi:prolipoprotein diacylglyceryltransferase